MSLFSVNTVFFTVLNYPMSYIEFFGTILNILSVYLVVKNHIWNWPIGNIAVVLFGILFLQIGLYSDFLEQIYFLITGFYGWYVWLNTKKNKGAAQAEELPITYNSKRSNIFYLVIIALGTVALSYVSGNLNQWFPNVFPAPASFVVLDAFTTVMSFAATILLAHKKIESWYLWILVDVIGIWLYYEKGVVFISLLYVLFLILATKGLLEWRKNVADA